MPDLATDQRIEALEQQFAALKKIIELPNANLPPLTSYLPLYNPDTLREEKLQLDGLNFEVNFIDETDVSNFGAKGDGVQVDDWAVTGTTISSASITFNANDVGKVVSIADAGASGEHLVGNIISVDTGANTATLDVTATTNVTGKLGSYGTPNMKPFQDAFDFAIQNNVKIKARPGVYLIEDSNPDNPTFKQVRINFTSENQNFSFEGAGAGLTVIRELDGKTQRIGRFTSIFYCNLPSTTPVGNLFISNLTMDKNGRSLTVNPPTLFEWEQAHAITVVKTDVSNQNTAKHFKFVDIEIFDKIGGGINHATSDCIINKYDVLRITQNNFGGNDGSILYGQRADVEIHPICENIVVSDSRLRYCQFEPVNFFSSPTRKRNIFFSNCTIDILEPTELTNFDDLKYHRMYIDNCEIGSLVCRGLTHFTTNSTIGITQVIHSVNGNFTGCDILVPWDDVANSVNGVIMTNFSSIKNRMNFIGCKFLIDDDLAVNPTGKALDNTSVMTNLEDNIVNVIDCYFDPRFDQTADCVNNGTWYFRNNNISGTIRGFNAGASGSNVSKLTLENNDYSHFTSGSNVVFISNSSTDWELVVKERLPHEKWTSGSSGSTGDINTQITIQPTLMIDDIANRAGFHRQGEVFEIISPSAGNYKYYQVTASGTGLGSTVKGFGLLEA